MVRLLWRIPSKNVKMDDLGYSLYYVSCPYSVNLSDQIGISDLEPSPSWPQTRPWWSVDLSPSWSRGWSDCSNSGMWYTQWTSFPCLSGSQKTVTAFGLAVLRPRNHIIAMVKNMVGGGDEVDGDTPLMEPETPQPDGMTPWTSWNHFWDVGLPVP